MKLHQGTQLNSVNKLVLSGLIGALTTLITLLSIPLIGGGYIHLGDTAIFVGLYFIGGPWGVFAGAVGSALTDLILGYAIYIPATFAIKALMAFTATILITHMKKGHRLIAFLIACVIVPVGYFIYEAILFGSPTAALNIPYNLLQAVLSAISGYLITLSLDKTRFFKS